MKRIAVAVLAAGLAGVPALILPLNSAAQVSVGLSITVAPPPLPVYPQPVVPGPGYIWTPGYWAWSPDGFYYWVPGAWVMPPEIGLLWTPGWWGWADGFYHWHAGYWAPQVGFYGGIDYGFGYFGTGYSGGYWRGRNFYYNRAVNNVNAPYVHYTYIDRAVVRTERAGRASFNGGAGGIAVRPPQAPQRGSGRPPVIRATPDQIQHQQRYQREPQQRYDNQAIRPNANRPEINRPEMNRPDRSRPDVNRPGVNRPGVNRPEINRPEINRAPRPEPGRSHVQPQPRGPEGVRERAQPRPEFRGNRGEGDNRGFQQDRGGRGGRRE